MTTAGGRTGGSRAEAVEVYLFISKYLFFSRKMLRLPDSWPRRDQSGDYEYSDTKKIGVREDD